MTPSDLRNIQPLEIVVGMHFHAQTWDYPSIFIYWWRSLLIATSKLSLLTFRPHSETRKHLFLYPQGDRSSLGKSKRIGINTNHSYHQHSSLSASLNWSNNKARFSFNQPNRKKWGAKLVDVKHLPHKAFLSWHHY